MNKSLKYKRPKVVIFKTSLTGLPQIMLQLGKSARQPTHCLTTSVFVLYSSITSAHSFFIYFFVLPCHSLYCYWNSRAGISDKMFEPYPPNPKYWSNTIKAFLYLFYQYLTEGVCSNRWKVRCIVVLQSTAIDARGGGGERNANSVQLLIWVSH